jgi:hypothetical protein
MKKIIYIFLISVCGINAQFPIEIKFNLHNDLKPENIYYLGFGVNSLAGDSVDYDLGELCLPPDPFSNFYACMEYIDSTKFIDDTTKYYDYINTNLDLRGIPDNTDKFYKKYKLHIVWYNSNKVILNWGTTPQNVNIDSIFVKDAFDGYSINKNMKTTNSLEITNSAVDVLYFHVYYTKTPTCVDDIFTIDSDYIYPNPVSNFIKNNKNIYTGYKIYGIYGKLMSQNTNINDIIDVSFLSKGLYLLYLNNADGDIKAYKFIKN